MTRLDGAACAALVLTAAGLGWPLLGDGLLTVLDHPVHLAELYERTEQGTPSWSELGFCGMPLGTLHSPLWYGLLAGLAGLGLPVEGLYRLAVWAGTVATPLALYGVGRGRGSPGVAWAVATLYLLLPTHTLGYASALGGMWTFHLGTGLLVLLAAVLARRPGTPGRWPLLTVLLAVIGLTHAFVLLAAAGLCLAGLAAHVLARRVPWRLLVAEFGAWGLAALCSIAYWGPLLFVLEPGTAGHQDLGPLPLLLRLVAPTDLVALLGESPLQAVRTNLLGSEFLVTAGLFTAGAIGLWRHRQGVAPPLMLLGLALAMLSLALLALTALGLLPPLLGPVSWRFVSFVHLGVALLALFAGPFWPGPNRGTRLVVALVILSITSAWWWNRPLATLRHSQEARDLSDLRETWRWLKDHKNPAWGRVALQNTFTANPSHGLGTGHPMALTRHHTGLRQVGTWYGIQPFPTGVWLSSQFGRLFGSDEHTRTSLQERLDWSLTDVFVSSHPNGAALLGSLGGFEARHRKGRFVTWVRSGASTPTAWAPDNAIKVTGETWAVGALTLQVDVPSAESSLVVGVAHHPWWQLDGPSSARLRAHENGLIQVEDLPSGSTELVLQWVPSRAWARAGWIGWFLLVGFAVGPGRKRPPPQG